MTRPISCSQSWQSRVQPSPPAQQYLARLSIIAERQPHLLIAHSFAMHSALMAGGQLTKRMLTKHVQLKSGKGTSTFDYQASGPSVPCCKAFIPALLWRHNIMSMQGGVQEPVQPLRAEYKQIINRLPEVLSSEELEEVHLTHAEHIADACVLQCQLHSQLVSRGW